MRKLFVIAALFLTSCDMAEKRHVVGNYYIVAADVREQMSLDYHTKEDGANYGTIIDNTVFAVGCNDKYIIVKQHPTVNEDIHLNDTSKPTKTSSNQADKTRTNYYIVPVEDYYRPNLAPLNEYQFKQQRKKLGIENIQFTIVYKDLE